jgi:hypothetical protein
LTACHVPFFRLVAFVLLSMASAANACPEGKTVIGWVERVSVAGNTLVMDAKVDTGADYSSVHADDIRHFVREDRRWIEFALRGRDGSTEILQRPLLRTSRIKTKPPGLEERPVVMLEICVGGSKRLAQVNLAQRRHFKYPLLLGRDFLGADYLVDPDSQHLLDPRCP